MWFLNFIPDAWLQWFIHGVLILGLLLTVVGAITKKIPFIGNYGTIVKAFGGLLFIVGVWFEGGYGVEMSYRARVAEMQAKVKEAEEKSAIVNTKIVEKLVTKTEVIQTRGEDIIKYVDREVVKYDEKFSKGGVCEIPHEFIKALNDAAEEPK